MNGEKPFRQQEVPNAIELPVAEQDIQELSDEGARQLADFILLLAKWDRMLTSSQSVPLPTTHLEAA